MLEKLDLNKKLDKAVYKEKKEALGIRLARLQRECREAGIPVNVADKKEECDFYFPGIARGGLLTAGICAGGKDHRLAKEAAAEVRQLFAEKYSSKEP